MFIDFPKEEIPQLSKQNKIITHRVLDDFGKFNINDIVDTPWNVKYKITGKKSISNINSSPFSKYLTTAQFQYLSKFDQIDVLRLEILI